MHAHTATITCREAKKGGRRGRGGDLLIIHTAVDVEIQASHRSRAERRPELPPGGENSGIRQSCHHVIMSHLQATHRHSSLLTAANSQVSIAI